MVDTTASRLGAVNAGTDDVALFLKVFSGEVLDAFEEANVMKNLQRFRTITSGQSAQFPVMGRAAAGYHAAGENILDPTNGLVQSIKHAEQVINVDDLLVAPVFIDKLDEARNHYDVREPYAQEMGRALAKKFDQNSLQTLVLAARAATPITASGPDESRAGQSIVDADFQTNGASAVSTLYQAAELLDDRDVPRDDRFTIVDPGTYWNLAQQTDLVNRDFSSGNGDYAQGTVLEAAGIKIVMSRHLPTTNITAAEAGTRNTYHGNFSGTLGVVFHRSAIGTVKLLDLAMESEYKIEYQGHLMVAKFAMGTGILRPESAIEIKAA